MRFSLQEMVRSTLAEAEMREKLAQAEGEVGPDDKKNKFPPKKEEASDNSGSGSPETNDESLEEKTSSVFVEKLASAVDYCNEHFIKEAVGKPEPAPVAKPKTTTVGPGIGATSMPNTIDTPTSGTQSENTGQATNNQLPMVPGKDVASPGQTNPDTALETDINSPPGGSEDWTKTDKMKQAAAIAKLARSEKDKEQLKQFLQIYKDDPKLHKAHGKRFAGNYLGGAALGGLTGAGLGAGASLLSKGRMHKGLMTAGGGMLGAGMGSMLGLGRAGKKNAAELEAIQASKNMSKAAQVDRVRYILAKMAADDINAAKVKATKSDVPPDASKAEEGVPSQPAEVNKQKSMVGSNDAAMKYTKQQAKAVPKARMGEVLSEPAQKKSTDPVLHENLDAASGAGVKLASVEKVAAARSLLQKIAEEGAKEDASPEEKEKALKLQEALKAKQKEKDACGVKQGSTMPLSGGY